jgi:hypothetical protein
MASPSETPGPLSQSHHSCGSLKVPCVSGASNLVSKDEVHIPCLHVPSPWRPSAHAAATSPANRDDDDDEEEANRN